MNNDDMDEAFRKAADDYELNEELAADWNGVHNALQRNQPQKPQVVKEKKRRRFMFFWWLLLLPAALFIAYATGIFSPGSTQLKIEKTATNIHEENTIPPAQNDIKKKEPDVKKDDLNNAKQLSNSANINSGKTFYANKNATGNVLQSKHINEQADVKNATESLPILTGKTIKPQTTNITDKTGADTQRTNQKTENDNQQNVTGNNSTKNNAVLNNQQTQANKLPVNDSAINPSLQKKKKAALDNYVRQAYKYAGLTANADLSFIKGQKTSAIGLGAGVIAGYHFKNGISVETGLSYNKKNYYTKGEYFNKSQLNDYLKYSTIITSDGNCNMWEIPLNVRYDFNTKRKYNWFVATGVSSYVMNKEYYYFTYEKDGEIRHHGYDYKHSSKNLFSVLNFDGGVSIKAGDKYLFQVQPYYKLPLSGVGIGSLSLKSTGMNINLVRRIK